MSQAHDGGESTLGPAAHHRGTVPGQDRSATDVEASTWVRDGIVTGGIGATLIALFFLIVDVLQGRPLWTPSALGSAVFLGKGLATDAAWHPPLVAAYSALHGGVFVAAGLAASFAWLGHRARRRGLPGFLLTAGVLFAAFEAFFLVFFVVFADSMAGGLLIGELGGGRIALANALAACAMAATTLWPPLGWRRQG